MISFWHRWRQALPSVPDGSASMGWRALESVPKLRLLAGPPGSLGSGREEIYMRDWVPPAPRPYLYPTTIAPTEAWFQNCISSVDASQTSVSTI